MGKVIPMLGGGGGTDLDMITATAADVRAGKVIVDKEGNPVTGTEPERGNWTGNVAMNGKITIPDGHHGGGGYVNGPAVTQRGAWNGSVGMNTQVAIPEGYHNGAGKVSGPSVAYQNADVSGTDRAYTTSISTWGGVICLGVRNGHYLNGVNWIQADIPGLQPANIKEGISIGNLKGTMKDYSYLAVNQVPFDGASFSGVMAGGAQEMFTSPGNPDYVNKKTLAITSNGVELTASRNSYTENKFCPNYAIDLSPFKTIRVSGKMLTPNPRARGNLFIQVWSKNTQRTFFFRKYPGVVNLKESKTELPYITDNPNYVQCYLDVGTINEAVFITIFFQVLNSEPYAEGYRYCFNKIEFLT